jgi:hypothetical protein
VGVNQCLNPEEHFSRNTLVSRGGKALEYCKIMGLVPFVLAH